MVEEQIIDGINRTFDDWVEIQLDDNALSPTEVIELLITEKSLDANEANYIVDRINRVIRKRNAVKEIIIGVIFLPIIPFSILLPSIYTTPFGLFGIVITVRGIYSLNRIKNQSTD